MNFAISILAWLAFLWTPLLIVGGLRSITADASPVWCGLAAVAIVAASLLRWVLPRSVSMRWRIVFGLLLGLLLPVLGGFALMQVVGGFESAAFFAGGVVMAIPGAAGGALAGWIQSRAGSLQRTTNA